MVAAYTVVLCALCSVKRHFYLYDDFDFAIFAQAAAQLRHGNFFDSIRGMHWLGDHASLILFAVAPLTWLFRSPEPLLWLQSFALALGAVPAYRMARRTLGSDRAGLAFAMAWLLQPAVWFLNLYEFHPEALCVPFFLFAFDALLEGRARATLAWSALALLGREDAALVVFGMAMFALARDRRLSAGLFALGAASLALSFGVLKPAFNRGEADFTLLYARWGGSPGAILRNVATHPLPALASLWSTPGDPLDTRLKFLFHLRLLAPLAFLPLAGFDVLLIGVPILFERMLADGHEQHSIHYHYAALLLPVIFAAGVRGARRFGPRAGLLVFSATLLSQAFFEPFGPWSGPDAFERVVPTAADRDLRPFRDAAVARVPRSGGVVASLAFLDRFADRADLHALHHVLSGHYSISSKPYPAPRGVTGLLVEGDLERTADSVDPFTGQRVSALLRDNRLHPVYAAGNLVLYEAGAGDTVELARMSGPAAKKGIRFDGALDYLGSALPKDARRGQPIEVRTTWARRAPVGRVYALGYLLLGEREEVGTLGTEWCGGLGDPVALWPADQGVELVSRPILPRDLSPGRYGVALRVGAWDGRKFELAACDDPRVGADRNLLRIGTLEVR